MSLEGLMVGGKHIWRVIFKMFKLIIYLFSRF